jgi:hypothetical protein
VSEPLGVIHRENVEEHLTGEEARLETPSPEVGSVNARPASSFSIRPFRTSGKPHISMRQIGLRIVFVASDTAERYLSTALVVEKENA